MSENSNNPGLRLYYEAKQAYDDTAILMEKIGGRIAAAPWSLEYRKEHPQLQNEARPLVEPSMAEKPPQAAAPGDAIVPPSKVPTTHKGTQTTPEPTDPQQETAENMMATEINEPAAQWELEAITAREERDIAQEQRDKAVSELEKTRYELDKVQSESRTREQLKKTAESDINKRITVQRSELQELLDQAVREKDRSKEEALAAERERDFTRAELEKIKIEFDKTQAQLDKTKTKFEDPTREARGQSNNAAEISQVVAEATQHGTIMMTVLQKLQDICDGSDAQSIVTQITQPGTLKQLPPSTQKIPRNGNDAPSIPKPAPTGDFQASAESTPTSGKVKKGQVKNAPEKLKWRNKHGVRYVLDVTKEDIVRTFISEHGQELWDLGIIVPENAIWLIGKAATTLHGQNAFACLSSHASKWGAILAHDVKSCKECEKGVRLNSKARQLDFVTPKGQVDYFLEKDCTIGDDGQVYDSVMNLAAPPNMVIPARMEGDKACWRPGLTFIRRWEQAPRDLVEDGKRRRKDLETKAKAESTSTKTPGHLKKGKDSKDLCFSNSRRHTGIQLPEQYRQMTQLSREGGGRTKKSKSVLLQEFHTSRLKYMFQSADWNLPELMTGIIHYIQENIPETNFDVSQDWIIFDDVVEWQATAQLTKLLADTNTTLQTEEPKQRRQQTRRPASVKLECPTPRNEDGDAESENRKTENRESSSGARAGATPPRATYLTTDWERYGTRSPSTQPTSSAMNRPDYDINSPPGSRNTIPYQLEKRRRPTAGSEEPVWPVPKRHKFESAMPDNMSFHDNVLHARKTNKTWTPFLSPARPTNAVPVFRAQEAPAAKAVFGGTANNPPTLQEPPVHQGAPANRAACSGTATIQGTTKHLDTEQPTNQSTDQMQSMGFEQSATVADANRQDNDGNDTDNDQPENKNVDTPGNVSNEPANTQPANEQNRGGKQAGKASGPKLEIEQPTPAFGDGGNSEGPQAEPHQVSYPEGSPPYPNHWQPNLFPPDRPFDASDQRNEVVRHGEDLGS